MTNLEAHDSRSNLDRLFTPQGVESMQFSLLDNLAEAGILSRETQRAWAEYEFELAQAWARDAEDLGQLIEAGCPKGIDEERLLLSTEEVARLKS